MKTKVITVATRDDEGLTRLKKSLDVPLEVLGMGTSWKGFGTKIILLKEYLKTLEDFTHFIFVDAYDVVFLKHLKHVELVYEMYFKDSIVFSAEKNCWPDPNLRSVYTSSGSIWNYLNSGAYIGPIGRFLEVIDKYPVNFADDDQLYFTKVFFKEDICLDYECKLFQSYSFVAAEEFSYEPTLINNITGTTPSIVHGNGRTDLTKIYELMEKPLETLTKNWKPTSSWNREINETFIERVNKDPKLKEHRDWVEQNIWGFGERSFYWMWKLLVDDMAEEFTFMEIGVFRGAILSLVKLLSDRTNKQVTRYGVTPLSPAEVGWESNYGEDIHAIHNVFALASDYTIIKGDSTAPEVIAQAKDLSLDILYIDGCHSSECVKSDIINYTPLLKVGGCLVIDDASCRFPMPFGYFTGIESVCSEVDKVLPPGVPNDNYEHLFNVVHNRVWRKVK